MTDKPKVKLIGEDGNIFNLVALASKEMRRQGMDEETKKMQKRILVCHSYDTALNIIMDYCDVE